LTERQLAGRFAYEYDRVPSPPLVVTVNVTFSPGSSVVGEAVKNVIEREELTAMLVVPVLEV